MIKNINEKVKYNKVNKYNNNKLNKYNKVIKHNNYKK